MRDSEDSEDSGETKEKKPYELKKNMYNLWYCYENRMFLITHEAERAAEKKRRRKNTEMWTTSSHYLQRRRTFHFLISIFDFVFSVVIFSSFFSACAYQTLDKSIIHRFYIFLVLNSFILSSAKHDSQSFSHFRLNKNEEEPAKTRTIEAFVSQYQADLSPSVKMLRKLLRNWEMNCTHDMNYSIARAMKQMKNKLIQFFNLCCWMSAMHWNRNRTSIESK